MQTGEPLPGVKPDAAAAGLVSAKAPETREVIPAKERIRTLLRTNWDKLKNVTSEGVRAVAEEIQIARMYRQEQKMATGQSVRQVRESLFGLQSEIQTTGLPEKLRLLSGLFMDRMKRLSLKPQVLTAVSVLAGPPQPLRG